MGPETPAPSSPAGSAGTVCQPPRSSGDARGEAEPKSPPPSLPQLCSPAAMRALPQIHSRGGRVLMGSQPNVSSVWLFDDYSLSSPEGSNGCHTREDVGLALAHEQLRHSGWYISKGQCWECYNTKNSSGTGLLELPLSQCAGFCFLPTPPHLASYIHGYTTQVRLVEVGGWRPPANRSPRRALLAVRWEKEMPMAIGCGQGSSPDIHVVSLPTGCARCMWGRATGCSGWICRRTELPSYLPLLSSFGIFLFDLMRY
jgi:hypothetical protein